LIRYLTLITPKKKEAKNS